MAYQLIEFDGVALPLDNPEQNHGGPDIDSALLDSIGGVADYYGTRRKPGRQQTIDLNGVYLGETTYLVDDAGNHLVDDAGNRLFAGLGPALLLAQVRALLEKRGVRGTLTRLRLNDNAREWKTARLLVAGWRQRHQAGHLIAEMQCRFETGDDTWKAADAVSVVASPTAGVQTACLPSNGGEAVVYDAVLTIACTSGTITQVDVDGEGIDWTYTGSIATGETVTVDCGAQTVRNGTTDTYIYFALNAGHSARGWLPLAPGVAPLTLLTTGGAATVTITWYPQFY